MSPARRDSSGTGTTLEPLRPEHWPAVARIYAEGIAGGTATFETAVPSYEVWDSAHLVAARLVALDGGAVVGWGALAPVSTREAYAGVAEVSVYVAGSHQRRGLGLRLLNALVAASEAHGIWTLQGSILAENEASIALHRRAGFRIVGRRYRIGRLRGVWRDVVLVERRSPLVD